MNFSNTSTGTITSYAWDFGDGGSSTVAAPSHSYAAAGTYTVSLTVTGPGGSNTQTRSNYVTATAAAPVAQFTGSPTSGVAPLTVSFSNTSTGSITSYAWDFGDGGSSTAGRAQPQLCGGRHLHGEPHRHRAGRQQHPDPQQLRDGRAPRHRSRSSPAARRPASPR